MTWTFEEKLQDFIFHFKNTYVKYCFNSYSELNNFYFFEDFQNKALELSLTRIIVTQVLSFATILFALCS